MVDAQKTWLEVSLNGAHSKASQPNGPHDALKIIEEGIACAEAGVAIIHFHAFYGDSDQQVYDADTYGRIIEGVRKYSDALVYGTVPMIGDLGSAQILTPEERYRPTEELLQAGLLDSFVVDAGLVNFGSYDGISANAPAGMYINPIAYVRYAMDLAKTYDVTPTVGVWEPGFLRTAAAVAKASGVTRRIMFKFIYSESMSFGFPPEPYALEAYCNLREQFAPQSSWMIAAAGGDVFPLLPDVLTRGGHVRVGMEDALLGCPETNVELVARATAVIGNHGNLVAAPSDIRRQLEEFRTY